MTSKLELILDLSDPSPTHIDAFVKAFGPAIITLVKNNGGNEDAIRSILNQLISDLYLKNKEGFQYDKYKIDPLVMTLSISLFKKWKKEKRKKSTPLLINQDYYEGNRIKLSIGKYTKSNDKCESVLNNLGEPGRTIMNLSFNKKESDESIVQHVHFDSLEQLYERRIKLLEKCNENLAL